MKNSITKTIAKQIWQAYFPTVPSYMSVTYFKSKEDFKEWVKQNYKTNRTRNYAFSVLHKNIHLTNLKELIDEGYFTMSSHSNNILTIHPRVSDAFDIEIAREQKAKN